MKVTLIGAQDFRRMRSCAYMKRGVSTRGVSWVFPTKEEANFSCDLLLSMVSYVH